MRYAAILLLGVLLFATSALGSATAHRGGMSVGNGASAGGTVGPAQSHSKPSGPLPGSVSGGQLPSLQALKQEIQSSSVPKGDVESLTHKLNAIQVSLEKGDLRAAANKVEAFIHELEAQHKAGRISDDVFNSLLSQAQQLRSSIESQISEGAKGRDENRAANEESKESIKAESREKSGLLEGIGTQIASLAQQLAQAPKTFGEVVVSLVRALLGQPSR